MAPGMRPFQVRRPGRSRSPVLRYPSKTTLGSVLMEKCIVTAEDYIDQLVARGRHHFTTADAVLEIGSSEDAVRAQLRRLKKRGRIATPMRSFHVVVPPQYRSMGCLPAEHFIDQLMEELEEPYYVALLSAAARHGAGHQRPQQLQVMVRRNRPRVECGGARVVFVARADMEVMPVQSVNTPHGYLRVATPEGTAFELVGYPRHGVGLSNVATVLSELAEAMDADKLVEVARLCPVGWSQRLGYLFELVEEVDLAAALSPHVEAVARSYIPLRRAETVSGASRSSKWKLIINVEVEPDL